MFLPRVSVSKAVYLARAWILALALWAAGDQQLPNRLGGVPDSGTLVTKTGTITRLGATGIDCAKNASGASNHTTSVNTKNTFLAFVRGAVSKIANVFGNGVTEVGSPVLVCA